MSDAGTGNGGPAAPPPGAPSAGTPPSGGQPERRRRRRSGAANNPAHAALLARSEPMLWLTGAGLTLCILMIFLLLGWICVRGLATFWPAPVQRVVLADGTVYLGEVIRAERTTPANSASPAEDGAGQVLPQKGADQRILLRTGSQELTHEPYRWIPQQMVVATDQPKWAVTLERLEWGPAHGIPVHYAEMEPLPPSVAGREDLARSLLDAPPAAGADRRGVVVKQGYANGGLWLLRPSLADVGADERLVGIADIWDGPPGRVWGRFLAHHDEQVALRQGIRTRERQELGRLNRELEEARLAFRSAVLEAGDRVAQPWVTAWENHYITFKAGVTGTPLEEKRAEMAAAAAEFGAPPERVLQAGRAALARTRQVLAEQAKIRADIAALRQRSERHLMFLEVPGLAPQGASGVPGVAPEPETPELRTTQGILVRDIVRGFPANQLGTIGKLGVYLDRWWEFLAGDPREANTEGGVFPAIFGTVLMTLLMCLAVVPLGVLAALYLREYARQGLLISVIRIAINNLAGVPSIVFGVFGLGFFCYIVGAGIDDLLYGAKLPTPTFGKGGLLWASLTLALLTLPVVIVATEEALSAVPNSMREGSYACGASKWQTIRRIVLPRALPGILTGAILAMARGAGEVAPLMLVGAVKLAPELPIDATAPFGLDRSFMHLGFHVFDLGFQSEDSEAARPMVYTTTLLLILIIAILNTTAILLRNQLRKRFASARF